MFHVVDVEPLHKGRATVCAVGGGVRASQEGSGRRQRKGRRARLVQGGQAYVFVFFLFEKESNREKERERVSDRQRKRQTH